MTKKDLEDFRYDLESIDIQREYIEEYKSKINKVTSSLSNVPGATRKTYDVEAEKLSNVLDLIDENINEVERLAQKQKEVNKQLLKVEQPYRMFLEKMYMQGKKLGTIAEEMHYGYDGIKKLKKRAIDKFEKAAN